MLQETQVTLNKLAERIENIETSLLKLVDCFEQITAVKSLHEEIIEIKKDVAKLAEEHNIFNKK